MLKSKKGTQKSSLYEDPLGRHCLLKGSLLFGGLLISVFGLYFMAVILLSVAGLNPWLEETDLSGKVFGVLTSTLIIIVGPLVLYYEVLPMRRFVVLEKEIRLSGSWRSKKAGSRLRRHILKAEEMERAELEIKNETEYHGAYPLEWECKIHLSDGEEYKVFDGSISGDSDVCLSALSEFFKANRIPHTVVRKL